MNSAQIRKKWQGKEDTFDMNEKLSKLYEIAVEIAIQLALLNEKAAPQEKR